MPKTVIANLTDETTKEVPVTWNPAIIATSTPGEKAAIGTVEGFDGTVTFKVIVEYADPIVTLTYRFDGTHNRVMFNIENLKDSIPNAHYYRLLTFKDNEEIGYQSVRRIIGKESVGILPSNIKIDGNTKFNIRVFDKDGKLLKTFIDLPVNELED